MEVTTSKAKKLLTTFSNAANILQFYGISVEAGYLMLYLCRDTKLCWDKHSKAFFWFLKENKMKLEYEGEFDGHISKFLLSENRYSKYSLSLYLRESRSYKIFTWFLTRIPHLKLLTIDKIVCSAQGGEYECLQKLMATFEYFNLDLRVLHNYKVFNGSGNFFPDENSFKYLHTVRDPKELRVTQTCDHLDFSNVIKAHIDFYIYKALKSITLRSDFLEKYWTPGEKVGKSEITSFTICITNERTLVKDLSLAKYFAEIHFPCLTSFNIRFERYNPMLLKSVFEVISPRDLGSITFGSVEKGLGKLQLRPNLLDLDSSLKFEARNAGIIVHAPDRVQYAHLRYIEAYVPHNQDVHCVDLGDFVTFDKYSYLRMRFDRYCPKKDRLKEILDGYDKNCLPKLNRYYESLGDELENADQNICHMSIDTKAYFQSVVMTNLKPLPNFTNFKAKNVKIYLPFFEQDTEHIDSNKEIIQNVVKNLTEMTRLTLEVDCTRACHSSLLSFIHIFEESKVVDHLILHWFSERNSSFSISGSSCMEDHHKEEYVTSICNLMTNNKLSSFKLYSCCFCHYTDTPGENEMKIIEDSFEWTQRLIPTNSFLRYLRVNDFH